MRPLGGSDTFQPGCRKPSLPESPLPAVFEAQGTPPVTFYFRRGSQEVGSSSSMEPDGGWTDSPVQAPAGAVDSLLQPKPTPASGNEEDDLAQSPRQMMVTKTRLLGGSHHSPSARGHTSQQEPLTPLLISSTSSSLPSSPKSISTRSLRPSEAGSIPAEDSTSQAVSSSGDEEPDQRPRHELEALAKSSESAPQLIMPSIKVPSRRPFTDRGKVMGNFKILIAGLQGRSRFLNPKAFV
jgi:hypothetical protein